MLRGASAVAPGVVIESACEDAILAGRVHRDHEAGPHAWIVEGDGWVAPANRRGRSPLGTRRDWRVTAVEPVEVRPVSHSRVWSSGRTR